MTLILPMIGGWYIAAGGGGTPNSTILSSFSSPSTSPAGLTHDGANLISCDLSLATIYIHGNLFSMTGRNLGTAVYVDGENRQALVTAEPNEVTRSVRVDQENRSAMISTRRNAA